MRKRSTEFKAGSGPDVLPSSRREGAALDRRSPQPSHAQGVGPHSRRPTHPRAPREALQGGTASQSAFAVDDELEMAGGSIDGPTNVYYLAQYQYQVSIGAVTMADHELAVLLPRSGHIWFNAKLFSDVPRGRELAQCDVWWRAIDASPAVRFLLGWCVGLYRTARFRDVAHEQLPGWSRLLYFSPTQPEVTQTRIRLWSDVIQDVTMLFAPTARIWQQVRSFAPIRAGDHQWQAQLVLANHRVEDVLHYLADRNNCPATLIRRSLDGNPPVTSYDEYLQFTETLLGDLPRLRMQRMLAVQKTATTQEQQSSGRHFMARLPGKLKGQRPSEIQDPRQETNLWHLYL